MPHDMTEAGPEGFRTGMAQSLLREISVALADLAATGTATAIDLRSLPLTPADRAELEEALGQGEVAAHFEISGESELWETAYSGVWWLRHLGGGGMVAAETIEITLIPDILASHPDDVRLAATRLADTLNDKDEKEETTHV